MSRKVIPIHAGGGEDSSIDLEKGVNTDNNNNSKTSVYSVVNDEGEGKEHNVSSDNIGRRMSSGFFSGLKKGTEMTVSGLKKGTEMTVSGLKKARK